MKPILKSKNTACSLFHIFLNGRKKTAALKRLLSLSWPHAWAFKKLDEWAMQGPGLFMESNFMLHSLSQQRRDCLQKSSHRHTGRTRLSLCRTFTIALTVKPELGSLLLFTGQMMSWCGLMTADSWSALGGSSNQLPQGHRSAPPPPLHLIITVVLRSALSLCPVILHVCIKDSKLFSSTSSFIFLTMLLDLLLIKNVGLVFEAFPVFWKRYVVTFLTKKRIKIQKEDFILYSFLSLK